MQIQMAVVQLSEQTWFKGEKNERVVQVLVLMDADKDKTSVMPSTVDYVMTLDEEKDINPEALIGTRVTIGCNGIKLSNNRHRFMGKLDRSTLAKGALRGAGQPVVLPTTSTAKVA